MIARKPMHIREEDAAPRAHDTAWYRCEHCENLHLCLFDEDERLLATATVDIDMLRSMLDVIRAPPSAQPIQ